MRVIVMAGWGFVCAGLCVLFDEIVCSLGEVRVSF